MSQETAAKVLVCITPQSNSKRLIDRGYEVISETGGELHILNVQKGAGIFEQYGAAELIQGLFEYGAQLGGFVYGLCALDIPECIDKFARDKNIDTVVIGESVKNGSTGEDLFQNITEYLKDKNLIILERKEENNVTL